MPSTTWTICHSAAIRWFAEAFRCNVVIKQVIVIFEHMSERVRITSVKWPLWQRKTRPTSRHFQGRLLHGDCVGIVNRGIGYPVLGPEWVREFSLEHQFHSPFHTFCMYIYIYNVIPYLIYIYTHIHVHMHACRHTYLPTDIHIHIYIHIKHEYYIYIRIYLYIHTIFQRTGTWFPSSALRSKPCTTWKPWGCWRMRSAKSCVSPRGRRRGYHRKDGWDQKPGSSLAKCGKFWEETRKIRRFNLQNSVMLMVSDLIEWVKRSCEKKKLDLSMMPVCKVMVNKVGRAEIERIISLLELTISW